MDIMNTDSEMSLTYITAFDRQGTPKGGEKKFRGGGAKTAPVGVDSEKTWDETFALEQKWNVHATAKSILIPLPWEKVKKRFVVKKQNNEGVSELLC